MVNNRISVQPNGDTNDDVVSIPNLREDRSGTLKLMSWWRQERVESANIMVVGAGALGNEVIKNLALMGIGNIFIADRDVVERANLSRSVLFRESNEGQRKVEVAAQAVKQINPDVNTAVFHGDIVTSLGRGVFRRMDVVIGCLDSRQARLAVNDGCWLTGIPWVDGAIQELFGEVRVMVPGEGACYACTLTDLDWRIILEARPCKGLAIGNILEGKVPTTPTISSIIAGIEAQEALKILHRMPSLAGKAFVFRGLVTDAHVITLNENPLCQSHFQVSEVIECQDAQADTMTFRELLVVAEKHLGKGARLNFRGMGKEIVISLVCPNCGDREEVCMREEKLTPDQAPCPSCGYNMRDPDETTHEFLGTEPFADLSLSKVGIPPLDILEAISSDNQRYIGIELTGDLPTVIQYN